MNRPVRFVHIALYTPIIGRVFGESQSSFFMKHIHFSLSMCFFHIQYLFFMVFSNPLPSYFAFFRSFSGFLLLHFPHWHPQKRNRHVNLPVPAFSTFRAHNRSFPVWASDIPAREEESFPEYHSFFLLFFPPVFPLPFSLMLSLLTVYRNTRSCFFLSRFLSGLCRN